MTVYKIINVVGESNESFSDAVKNAVDKAAETVKKIKYAEIERFTVKINNDAVTSYRAEVKLSFEVEKT